MTRDLRDAFPPRRMDPCARAMTYVDIANGNLPDPAREARRQRARDQTPRSFQGAAIQTLPTMPSDARSLEAGRVYRVATTPAQFIVQSTDGSGALVIKTITLT